MLKDFGSFRGDPRSRKIEINVDVFCQHKVAYFYSETKLD